MFHHAPWGALLVGAMLLPGCANGPGAPSAPATDVAGPLATYTEGSGAIEGIVTDDQLVPLENAALALSEMGISTQTGVGGRFAFSDLLPGDYAVLVAKDGFEGLVKVVQVVASRITTTSFALTPVPSSVPYHQTLPFSGTSGFCLHVNGTDLTATSGRLVRGCPTGFDAIYPTTSFATSLPRWSNLSAVVIETSWNPTQAATQRMKQVLVLRAEHGAESIVIAGTAQAGMLDVLGSSPIKLQVLNTTLRRHIERSNERFGDDAAHNITEDWGLRFEVGLMPEQTGAGASPAISQRWDLLFTWFVGEWPTPTFTALSDG